MVPVVALPPVIPLTCHVTAALVEFVTVAVNCWVTPPAKVCVVGLIVIVSACKLTCADANFVGSACETAATVTVATVAIFAGAV